ncbi:MAG: hypothetical protein ACKVW3_01630 [Phycisphaerales bacterium]
MKRTWPLAGWGMGWAVLASAGLAQPAMAQRALDANQQVGSGGINPQGRDFSAEVRFRNAIITGNAPGGISFRGDVGYRAPGEFLGSLGSNDNFAFRRDSVYSGLAGMGIRGTDALQYQFAMTTGGAPPKGLMGSGVVSRSGSSASATAIREGAIEPGRSRSFISNEPREEGPGIAAIRSPSSYVADRGLRPSLLATYDQDGTKYGLSASTLRGVTYAPLDGLPPKKAKAQQKPLPEGALPTGAIKPDTAAPEATKSPFEDLIDRMEGKRRGEPKDPKKAGLPGAESGKPDDGTAAGATDGRVEGWRETIARLKAELADDEKPGAVKKAAERKTGELIKPDRPAKPIDDGTNDPKNEKKEGGANKKNDKDGADGKDDGATRSRREAINLLRSLSAEPPLTTMAPKGFDAYSEHMAEAERHMLASRYFDAEERFTAALSSKPRDAMSAIGRVHAALGAGVFVSASINLRDVLTAHPEAMGVRYAPALLPRPGRITTIVDRLSELISMDPNRSRDAGLLLAYLGYQTDRPEMVERGLKAARALPEGAPPDQVSRLVEVAAEVWTKKKERP